MVPKEQMRKVMVKNSLGIFEEASMGQLEVGDIIMMYEPNGDPIEWGPPGSKVKHRVLRVTRQPELGADPIANLEFNSEATSHVALNAPAAEFKPDFTPATSTQEPSPAPEGNAFEAVMPTAEPEPVLETGSGNYEG